MATRHHVRQSVVGILYAKDVGNEDIDNFRDEIFSDNKIKNDQYKFAISLLEGVDQNIKDIDSNIELHLDKRTIKDVGMIERAILRLGAYEILFSDLDKAVVINEAIEIAKELCAPSSKKFINAILDKVSK